MEEKASAEAKRRRRKKLKILYIIGIVFFSCVLVFSGIMIYVETRPYAESEEFYEATASETVKRYDFVDTESGYTEAPIYVDFGSLGNTYDNVIGWLWQDGTKLNYPVAQTTDNTYYLHRLLNGAYNEGGTLFADCDHIADLTKLNFVIYGHHMLDKSMFGNLSGYKKQSYYDAHPVMWYATKDATYRLDLLAGLIVNNDDTLYHQFTEREQLDEFLTRAYKDSTFKTTADTSEVEKIIILSTCSYEYNGARFVVVAHPVEVGGPTKSW